MTSSFEVKKTDTDLIKIMLTKVDSIVFVAMILDHMENPNEPDDLKELRNEIGKIQKSDCSSNDGEKETQLNSAEGGGIFKGICGNYKTWCGYKKKERPKKKSGGNCGGSGGGGNGKYCDHWKTKGHDKPTCWKLHPELAPQWYKDLRAKSDEAARSSVKMMLAQVNESEAQDFGLACL